MSDNLRERGGIVEALAQCLHHGAQDLKTLPLLVVRVIEDAAWRKRVVPQTGEVVGFDSFAEFAKTPLLEGLGTDRETLLRLCGGDIKAQALIEDHWPTVGQGARSDLVDNVHEVGIDNRPTGNSRARALRRLRKDAPELHAKVVAKEMSPNKAMVKAGFRKRTATIPVDDPEAAARTIRRQFTRESLIALIAALLDNGSDE